MTGPVAAELGRIAAPPRPAPYEDIRLTLLDTIVAANSQARLGQEAWEEAFGGAMRSLRIRLVAEAEALLAAAAARSRYPARRLRALLPDAEAADTLLHRLLAEGMPLERYEGWPDDEPTRRARAAALEAAWDGATRVAAAESAGWHAVAVGIAEWRRPTGPLWFISAAVLLVALLLAAWLSGAIPSPRWFKPINTFWWRLWP